MQPPLFPSVLPTRYRGAASGQELSELLVESIKEQNKEGVVLFSYTSAPCCFGDFAAWEDGKTHFFPPIPPCTLGKEKAHMLRKAIVQASPEHVSGTLHVAVSPLPGKL